MNREQLQPLRDALGLGPDTSPTFDELVAQRRVERLSEPFDYEVFDCDICFEETPIADLSPVRDDVCWCTRCAARVEQLRRIA